MPKRTIILLLLSIALESNGQGPGVSVGLNSRYEFKYPWAGGMNSCQFGKLDLDLDGMDDLVVFDRVGDRILPFLVVPQGESYDYKYAPEYIERFPNITQWAVFDDYNLDGKADIFTYSPGYAGMKVYRNTSENQLEFRLEVFPFLKSYQGGGYVNILVTYADFPAITDLDSDGDLDILTFWGLGSFVERHRNMSMEKYGNADSLDFEKVEYCWGYFAESDETNLITLDTCLRCDNPGYEHPFVPSQAVIPSEARDLSAIPRDLQANPRHTGSTFCILDLNGDQLPDLLLGDVNYPNLVALYNGGNMDTARITSYDWQYPAVDQTVDLFAMPAAFYDDFDFDGIKDLLVSPFDPNLFLTENFHSNWLYQNKGTDDEPEFILQTRSFLQKDMLDFGAGAYPVFFDLDQDGLTDILAGNYGYYDTSYFDEFLILHTIQTGQLAFLKNTGTASQPAFTLIDRDFAGISEMELTGIAPAIGDLDGDGDPDMLTGSETGQLIYFENTAGQGNTPDFEMIAGNFQGIDVGFFSTPVLFDLDGDQIKDLVIGERGGNLNYYRNTGTVHDPVFSLVTDSLGKINVTDNSVSLDGYSVPCFYRDGAGHTHLVVGSEQGIAFYYCDIDGNLDGKFTLSDTLAGLIGIPVIRDDFGARSAPAIADLDNDGFPELVAGNFSGGMNYCSKNSQSPINLVPNTQYPNTTRINIFPNPAHDWINIHIEDSPQDEVIQLFIFDQSGRIIYNYSGSVSNNFIIPSKEWPMGIYTLKIIFRNEEIKDCQVYYSKIILF